MKSDAGDMLAWKCQNTIVAFFKYLDERNYPALVALMDKEGSWLRNGKELRGEGEIMEAMNARAGTSQIHHILTNVQIAAGARPDELHLSGYLMWLRNDGDPPALKGPLGIHLCNAEVSFASGEPRIRRVELHHA